MFKVLGFSNEKILVTILSQNLFLTEIESILGIAVGINVTPLLLGKTETYLCEISLLFTVNYCDFSNSSGDSLVRKLDWLLKNKKLDMPKSLKAKEG